MDYLFHEFGIISKKSILKEVLIRGRQAITIKGDTVEFAADSFKTKKFDDVDALLRQLPGIQVNNNGSITAYGQSVQKMLVDGEEFFNDDPAMVAKMLRASSVDAVQVYDKKSEQAEFTGIDDGEKIKTINLKLKEDAKNGYFGKVRLGGGLKKYWENLALINSFKGKRKLAAYFNMSNTFNGGLGFDDAQNFGSSQVIQLDDGSYASTIAAGDNPDYSFGEFAGKGLPSTYNGGIHYSNSWKGDTLKTNGTVSGFRNELNTLNNNLTQYILPDTQYFNTQNSKTKRSTYGASFRFKTDYKIDSLTTLTVLGNGAVSKARNSSVLESEAASPGGVLLNDQSQTQTNEGYQEMGGLNIGIRHKFRKPGRSLAVSVNGSRAQSHSVGLLNSTYHLFDIDSSQITNQRKIYDNQNGNLGASLNYTEPIIKNKFFLLTNYQFHLLKQESQIRSLNSLPGSEGNYQLLDSAFSSHYNYNNTIHSGGLKFRWIPNEKIILTFGANLENTRYHQIDRFDDSKRSLNFLNILPVAYFSYRKGSYGFFSVSYNTQTMAPTMDQVQPVRNNNDPLNVAIGNPSLKQAYSHHLSFSYNNYKAITQSYFSANGGLSLISNGIVQNQEMSESGLRTYQFVNTNGNYSGDLGVKYGRKIIGDLSGSLSMNGNYARSHNFINGLDNINNSWGLGPGLSFSYTLDTILNLDYSFKPNYNTTVSSVHSDIKTGFWNFPQQLSAGLELPARLHLRTEIDWEIRQQLNSADVHNKVFLWNAGLSRSFLKDRSLILQLSVYDILNQNIGYNRVATAEQISQSIYNTIPRYFMVKILWNFSKKGGPKDDGGVLILGQEE